MATQIIIALCEGPHDVAFICKILKCVGFESNEKNKINDFPLPMNKLMEQEILKTEVRELNLQQVRQNLLPLNTLQRDDNFVFMYSIGGNGKREARKRILTTLKNFVPNDALSMKEINKERLPDGTQLSLIYFFDADEIGVNARLTEVRNEIKEILTTMAVEALPINGSYGTYEGLKLGSYIFTGNDNNSGKLEDILVPLMQSGNEEIFLRAESYLDENHDPKRIFPYKLTINHTGIISESRSTRSKDTDYDRRKSVIGIAGQLQRSGKSNTVYISDTDYLTFESINGNKKCQEIVAFFDKFINNT